MGSTFGRLKSSIIILNLERTQWAWRKCFSYWVNGSNLFSYLSLRSYFRLYISSFKQRLSSKKIGRLMSISMTSPVDDLFSGLSCIKERQISKISLGHSF